ncbi:hypothetical protein ACIP5Y_09460 [Nocardia sp. NPDC088792]|uniref:hypothetical protein n=1 Tax=Nocardia sp. NPDC088792 TaxID=3364332 RepID=UPI003819C7F8
MTKKTPEIRLQGYDSLWFEWLSQMYGMPVATMGRMTGMRSERLYNMVRRWYQTENCHVARLDSGSPGSWRRSFFDAPDAKPNGPLWVWPTRQLAWGMLDFDPGDWEPKTTTAAHLTAVGHLRYALTGIDTDPDVWTSERILRRRIDEGFHLHDAWMLDPEDYDKIWGIEVELSYKYGAGRLAKTIKAALESAEHHDLAGVQYFVRGADLRRAVQRAANYLGRERGLDLSNLRILDLDAVLVGQEVA